MIDLLAPVVMKGEPWTFERYRDTLRSEQASCLAWIGGDRVDWTVPAGLIAKVDADGRLRPFHGDTTVVPLDEDAIARLSRLQERMRGRLGDMLAQPLDPDAFHVTLHDLSAGPSTTELEARMRANQAAVEERFRALRPALAKHPRVRLEATAVYPSVNTSVVVGLAPAADTDFRVLINAYNVFDEVVRLGYWLRPHVTLDYFRPRPFGAAETRRLAAALHEANPPSLSLDLDLERLAYQRFTDMNHYQTLLQISAPACPAPRRGPRTP